MSIFHSKAHRHLHHVLLQRRHSILLHHLHLLRHRQLHYLFHSLPSHSPSFYLLVVLRGHRFPSPFLFPLLLHLLLRLLPHWRKEYQRYIRFLSLLCGFDFLGQLYCEYLILGIKRVKRQNLLTLHLSRVFYGILFACSWRDFSWGCSLRGYLPLL